ncbi:uncharacterized protein LOC100369687, partial [Saccoglossus kowalevskii]|uniref:Centromere-associated protein E-like n=1 Tax=Saccoglossus kowalevskii TaxID=10224 RepID=A0ABM0GXS5_SACKO
MAEMNNVKVAIRVRPFISREEGQEQFWQVKEKVKICEIDPVTLKSVSKSYYFDRVFDSHETTNDVYSEIGLPIVQSAMDGYHGTIFAYGQTSSGKTYTMQGTERNPGVIRRAIRDIFDSIEKTPDREFLLRVSYSELYNEELKDLLSSEKKSLTIREDGKRVFVQNLTEELVNGYSQVMDLLRKGEGRRHIAGTNMNEHSSRSHTIFCIVIESREYDESNESNDTAVKVAHLNLVDLAGSERANETGAEGTRLQEACKINQSLFCLGQVINKLSSGSSHIPYRESKLTRMLQSSLGGNAKTAIICTVTPATVNLTHSTLQFASSAKTVMNNAKMNEVLSDEAMLKKYKTEIKGLKERIQQLEEGNASVLGPETQLQFAELLAFKEKQEEQIEKLKKLFIVSSVASTPKKIKTKSNRRETWCPGTRKPFFPPPRLGAASLGLSPIGECSSDEQTVMSVFRKHNLSVRGDETEASFSGTIEFSPACDNSVFLNDLDEKAQQLDSSLPVKFEEMPPPPPPPPQSSVTSQRRKRRNLVHFADAPMKLLEEHTQDKGSQTDTVEDVVIETNIDANDELQQQLSELSSVSESLTAENIDLQNQLFNAENRVEELVLVKSQLEEEASLQQQQSAEKLEEILIENTRLREEIISKEAGEQGGSTHLEQTLADLEMLLRAREVEISMLKEMVSAAEDEKDNLRERHSASVSELNQRIEELQNQPRNELLVSTSNENDEVHLLKQKNEEFKKELEEALGLCERVVMEKTTLEQDFENAKDDRDRLHGDYLMLQGQYEALHTELEKKESELKDLEEFTRLEKDVEEQEIAEVKEKHQLDISHFKTNLESQTEKINELSEQVTHYKRISCEIAGDANIVQTVESLRKSCSDAEQVAMDTNKKLSQKVTESEALKEKLEKLQKQVKQLETEKSDFEFHIEMQQKRHNSLSKQLREDLQCTFSEISQLKGEEVVSVDQLSSSGKEKIEQLETEVKRHSETIGELEAERQNLSLKLTEIETHREALTKDLQAMEKEKGEAEEQCLILKAERESLNAKIEELLKTTSELEVLKDLHAMEKEKDEAEEQCLILKAEKESLNAKIEELLKATSNLEALTKDLQAMEKEKAEAEEQCLILRAEKDSLNSKIEELLKATSNLEALSKDLQAMEKEKAEAEEQCLILRAEKENLNAKIEELLKATSNLEALTKDLQAMEKEKAEVVEQCLILKAEKESLNAKIEERLEATSNLEVLRKDLQAIKKEKDEVVEQCLILKAEKESLNAKIEERLEATSNLEALKKDLQAMEKEKDEVVEQCLILKAEKESLNSKIEEHLKTTSKLEALRDSIVSDLEAEQNWHVESNQKCMVLESEKENLLLKMKSLEDRLLSLNAENNIDEQSQEIEVLKSKILELENERDILSNQVGDLITEKETLTSSMVELGEIQKSENMEESQTLMMEKAEMIDKLKNLVNEKDDLSSQVEELNIEKENLVAMLSDFQKSSSELLVSKLQVVCSERDALVEKVQCLERAQKTAQSEIEQLNTERLEMIIKIQELEILQSSDNTELDSKYSALLQSLAEVKEALRDARSEKAALETEKEDLSTKLRMLQSEKENLMDQLMTVKEELASLTEERDELKSDLNDNINEAIVVQDDLLQHQDMLEESKNKIKELKEAQQDMVSEMEFMVQQQQTLQSDLEEELSKNLKMCEQVMMFEVNEKSLKDEINSYKQQMDEATVELEKLTNKQIESEDASLKVSEENVILQEKLCTLETKLSLAVESVQDTTGSSEECQRLNDQVQRLLVDLHKMEELEELTRKEADILQKEVEELRAELTLSNKQNVQLEENGTESSEECQRLNDQVQRLLVDLRQMEELKELTRKEADILLKEMEELKAELTLTNKQNVLLEENLRAAKDISDSLSGLQEEVDELRQKNEFLEKVKTASFNETSGLQVKLVELERQLQLERAVNEDINGQVGNSQEIIAEFERKLQEEC